MHMTEFLLLLTALLLTGAAILARYWWRQRYPTLSISLQQVLYASDTAGWLTTSDLKIVDSNPAAKQLESTSARLPLYFGHASTEFADDELRQMIDSDEWQGQLWLGDTSRLACKARIVPLPYQHWLIWLEPNVHQLAQQQRQYDALFSPNSRLPNSQVFEFGLRHFVSQYQHHCHSFALVFIELPELENLQQLLTPPQTQQLWCELAHSIEPELPLGSLMTERQSNQLALLVPLKSTGSGAWQELELMCKTWLSFARGPYLLDTLEISPQLRLGAAVYPDAGREPDELVNHTAQALWQARQTPQQLMLWQQTQQPALQEPLVEELENALLQYQCEMHYQALHQLETNQIVAYCAQLYWQHPTRGELTHEQLMSMAEQASMRVQFECWALEQSALAMSQHLQAHGAATVVIAISYEHLLHGDLLNNLQQLCSDYQLLPSQFVLALTEQGFLQDAALFSKQCQQLVRAGFLLALHEFGQGLCALKVLSAVSWHWVILSGRLIDPIEHSDNARNHLACLIRLVHARQLHVIAADVTQEMQAYLLHVMGCRDAYGEFWGPGQTAKQWHAQAEIAETA